MITWYGVKSAIKAAVVASSGLVPGQIAWAKRPQSATNRAVVLQVVDAPADGYARVVETLSADSTSFDIAVSKTVTFTVNVRAEVPAPDANGDSQDLAEAIRLGLELPSIKAALKAAANVVVVAFPMSVTPFGSIMIDQREVDTTSFDVQFRAEFSKNDPLPQGWIERVEGEGVLTDVDGTEIHVTFEAERP